MFCWSRICIVTNIFCTLKKFGLFLFLLFACTAFSFNKFGPVTRNFNINKLIDVDLRNDKDTSLEQKTNDVTMGIAGQKEKDKANKNNKSTKPTPQQI